MFDWITGIIEASGAAGIAFLMLFENVFPPIPSELVMPLAGYLVYDGRLGFLLVVLAGTLGSVVGAWLWYALARKLGRQRLHDFIARHGKWLTIGTDDLDRAEHWFEAHQGRAVFFGRLIPGIRTLISVPAGFVEMPQTRFIALTLAGSLLWVTFLTSAGLALGTQYERVQSWLNPVSTGILIAIVTLYLFRLIRQLIS